MTGGTLSFAPISATGGGNPGKPAGGVVQPDGSFVLSTYTASDGAVVGRHRVAYSPPIAQVAAPTIGPDGSAVATPTPPSPYDGLVSKESEVEVKKGSNQFTIELVRPGGAPAPNAPAAPVK